MSHSDRFRRRAFRGAAALGLTVTMAAAMSAQTPPSPSPAPAAQSQGPILAPGEVLVPLKGGCAIVLGGEDSAWAKAKPEDIEKIRASYANWIWDGPCRFGVAHGTGWFAPTAPGAGESGANTFVYGHQLGRSARYTRMQLGGRIVTYTSVTYIDSKRNLTLANLPALDRPSWGDLESSASFSDGQQIVVVQAFSSSCGAFRNVFRGCANGNENANVYGLALATDVVPPPGKARKASTYKDRRAPCPNYYDPSTCGSAWAATLAPYRATIEDIIKATDARDRAITEKATAPYAEVERVLAEAEARRTAEAKAAADKAAAEKAAAEKAAAEVKAAAEKLEAEKAATEKAREEAAFADSLKTLNAGELFVKATDLRNAGQPDRAQTTLKSLLTRYPNSPLAAQAAQQLSSFGSGTPPAAPIAPPRQTPAPQPRPAAAAAPQWTKESSFQAMLNACASQVSDLRTVAQSSISPITHRNGWPGEAKFQENLRQSMSMIYSSNAQELENLAASDDQYFSTHPLRQTGNVEADGMYRGQRVNGVMLNCMRRQRAMQIRGQVPPPGGAVAATPAAAGSPAGDVAVAGCTMTQNQALQAFDSQFKQLTDRYPQIRTYGSRAIYQYAYFVGSEGMKIIEPLKTCMGIHYTPNRNTLQGMIDNGKRGCEQLAIDPSACVPQYPTQ